MKFTEALVSIEKKKAISFAQGKAQELGLNWQSGIGCVFQACLDNEDLAPTNISVRNGTAKDVIEKWIQKYFDAFNRRISIHHSNLPSTIADPMIDVIIQGRLPHLDRGALKEIKFAHRLSMSAENILGLLLEEYLSNHLSPNPSLTPSPCFLV